MAALAARTSPVSAAHPALPGGGKRARDGGAGAGGAAGAGAGAGAGAYGAKRARVAVGGAHPAARAGSLGYLRLLFPGMDDEKVARVLDECSGDIDAAIAKLNGLKLEVQQTQEKLAAEAQRRESEAEARTGAPSTAQEWVERTVQELSTSADMDDARRKAAKVLQAFEQAILAHAKGGPGGSAQLGEIKKENAILKRALAIQNSRLQEAVEKEAEMQKLREVLTQYQEQMKALESSNYALQVHLKQSHSASPLPDNRHRDIF